MPYRYQLIITLNVLVLKFKLYLKDYIKREDNKIFNYFGNNIYASYPIFWNKNLMSWYGTVVFLLLLLIMLLFI